MVLPIADVEGQSRERAYCPTTYQYAEDLITYTVISLQMLAFQQSWLMSAQFLWSATWATRMWKLLEVLQAMPRAQFRLVWSLRCAPTTSPTPTALSSLTQKVASGARHTWTKWSTASLVQRFTFRSRHRSMTRVRSTCTPPGATWQTRSVLRLTVTDQPDRRAWHQHCGEGQQAGSTAMGRKVKKYRENGTTAPSPNQRGSGQIPQLDKVEEVGAEEEPEARSQCTTRQKLTRSSGSIWPNGREASWKASATSAQWRRSLPLSWARDGYLPQQAHQ